MRTKQTRCIPYPALNLSLATLVELAAHNSHWPDPCVLPHYAVRANTRHHNHTILERIQECWIVCRHFALTRHCPTLNEGYSFSHAIQSCNRYQLFVGPVTEKFGNGTAKLFPMVVLSLHSTLGAQLERRPLVGVDLLERC